MFHSFFSSLARSRYLSLFSLSFSFTLWFVGTAKSTIWRILIFLLIIVWPRLGDLFVSQNHREVCTSHILDGVWVVHIPFGQMVKFKFLAQFPVDHLPCPVVSSLIFFFALIYCIRLLCNRSFRLYHHITNICYFVASCLFLP